MWRRERCCSATVSEFDSPNKLREPDRAGEGGGGLGFKARDTLGILQHTPGPVITTFKDPAVRGQPGTEGHARMGIKELV
ncbi:hypothetical protein ROHU_029894 [Labeo rohita]|uniref:Uncharacterized protein n=1 Tax=Labeo rohita TaxID=84645 RepID=A0A498M253_LABRO|nr:hypothetical protein ROHU_029894 [Labeo rohita]